MVSKKCPNGLQRIGCCSCGLPCPSNYFKAKGFYCLRDRKYSLDKFKTKKECSIQYKSTCMKIKVNSGNYWVPGCAHGFKREGSICRILCPNGYKKYKGKCVRKGIISLGTPFVWIKSDK